MGSQRFMVEWADHRLAPGVGVRRHLVSGESREWCPIITEDQEFFKLKILAIHEARYALVG